VFAKIIVIALLIAVVASLASGLLFVVRDQGRGERAVRALTLRIGISLLLFVVLFVLWGLGLVAPHGVHP